MRRFLGVVGVVAVAGCGRFGFDDQPLTSDATRADAPMTDGPSVIDAPPVDASAAPDAVPPGERWVVVNLAIDTLARWQVIPFGPDGFGVPCPDQPADDGYVFMHGHPDLPYAYAVESQFEGLALSCGPITTEPMSTGATSYRARQRIVIDPASGVGFFTIDGPVSLGVYRFTTEADGTPVAGGSADAPGTSGALVLDASRNLIVVGGSSEVRGYALDAGLGFPDPLSTSTATSCAEPVDLLISGDSLVAFCASGNVFVHPLISGNVVTAGSEFSGIGPIDAVVALPDDRAVAALREPARLVSLSGSPPTWTVGPTLASRVIAMAAGRDGIVITGRQAAPGMIELAAWRGDGDQLVLLDTLLLLGELAAVAVTAPPAS